MESFVGRTIAAACGVALWWALASTSQGQLPIPRILPEQRTIRVRDPSELPRARMPASQPPLTVSRSRENLRQSNLTLDDAIRWSLANSEVVRVLAGVQAVASGSTIYDAAITNTQVDEQQGQFDPNVNVTNEFREHRDAASSNSYGMRAEVRQKTISGASVATGASAGAQYLGTAPSHSQASYSAADLSLTQPLLQGFSRAANLAPIVIARINTERSYFQMKDALQENVRSVVEDYWLLVNARTDAWTRRQQVLQAEEAFRLANGRLKVEINNAAEVAQARLTLANFRAQLVGAEGTLLQREAALRNLLGFPPADGDMLVPVTPPAIDRYEPDWDEIVALAEERRPDLIELKLIIEADQLQVVQARNQSLPQLDAEARYRWNGTEGEFPVGDPLQWTLGVNFSVPLGLRQPRATLRRTELVVARDRANLQQGLHAAIHELGTSVRRLAQAYEQYMAFKEAREAARVNLEQQQAQYRANRVIFLNVLQAITDWGNAIRAEADSLTLYNTLLATLERQTGTILETHGVVLYEESFGAIGPAGRLFRPQSYPRDVRPTDNEGRYPESNRPSEESFDLIAPATPRGRAPDKPLEPLPPPRPAADAPNPPELPSPRPRANPTAPKLLPPNASATTRRAWQPVMPTTYQQ